MGTLPPSKPSRQPWLRAARQDPSNHTNKVSRQCELLWRVSVLLQEELTTTGLAPLIRCQCSSAPRSENSHAAHTEGPAAPTRIQALKPRGKGFVFFFSTLSHKQKTPPHSYRRCYALFCARLGWMGGGNLFHAQAETRGTAHQQTPAVRAVNGKLKSLASPFKG